MVPPWVRDGRTPVKEAPVPNYPADPMTKPPAPDPSGPTRTPKPDRTETPERPDPVRRVDTDEDVEAPGSDAPATSP